MVLSLIVSQKTYFIGLVFYAGSVFLPRRSGIYKVTANPNQLLKKALSLLPLFPLQTSFSAPFFIIGSILIRLSR